MPSQLNFVRMACALLVVGYGVFLAIASQQGFPNAMTSSARLPYVSDKPVGEDGYYMLLIAWNFASSGRFIANFDAV
jgi:hypothetical protein